MRDDLVATLTACLRRFGTDHDAGVLWEGDVTQAADRLFQLNVSTGEPVDLEATQVLGWLYWHRFSAADDAGDNDTAAAELDRSLFLFAQVYAIDPALLPGPIADMVNPDARRLDAELGRRQEAAMVAVTTHHRTGSADALDAAIELFADLIQHCPEDHPSRAMYDSNLAGCLLVRFQVTNQRADLDKSIMLSRSAAIQQYPADTDYPRRVSVLANALLIRHQTTGALADLTDGIAAAEAALTNRPSVAIPQEAMLRVRLASAFHQRFRQLHDKHDLDAAVMAAQEALAAPDLDRELLPVVSSELGAMLQARFRLTGVRDDLDLATEMSRRAFASSDPESPGHSGLLSNLGMVLRTRFDHFGDEADISEAVEFGKAAVAAATTDTDRLTAQFNLGNSLRSRFDYAGQLQDLDQAIDLFFQAAQGPVDRQDGGARLSNLGEALRTRFRVRGDLADLDRAVDAGRRAIALTAADDPAYARRLSHLGRSLRVRFERRGSLVDLDEAIEIGEAAIKATSQGNVDESARLSATAAALLLRFNRVGNDVDLNRSIDLFREAMATRTPDHPEYPRVISGLTVALRSRFERDRRGDDLREAISIGRRAASAVPRNSRHRPVILINLATALEMKSRLENRRADLDEAVGLQRQAVAATEDRHPDQSAFLWFLGGTLQERYEHYGNRADHAEACALWKTAARHSSAAPGVRIRAASMWGRRAAEDLDYPSAIEGFALAVTLLPEIAWHGLDDSERRHQLEQWGGLGTSAAACAISDRDALRAIQLLEHGRAVMWTQLLQARGELNALQDRSPGLAIRLTQIRNLLDSDASASLGLGIPS